MKLWCHFDSFIQNIVVLRTRRCGDGVMQLQTFLSWISYKHILEANKDHHWIICTPTTLFERAFFGRIWNIWSIFFVCNTPPMESFFEVFLNCQVKFTSWRWRQINKFNAFISRDNYFLDLKKKFTVCIGASTPHLKNSPLLFSRVPP